MKPPQQRKNKVEKAEKIRDGNAFYAVLLCLSLICAVACSSENSSEKTPQQKSEEAADICLAVNVSSTSEALIITNTGNRSWGSLYASLEEGWEDDDSKNSFDYTNEDEVVPPDATVTIPLNKFVRDDGLRFDPAKYVFKGISVTAWSGRRGLRFGGFFTTDKMDRDDRGVYLNDCKNHL
jgi:hypothetical protein